MSKINYVIYNTTSGEIVAAGTGSSDLMSTRVGAGESYLTTSTLIDPENKEVVNGVVVSISASVIAAAETAKAWKSLRGLRDAALASTDWTVVEDTPVTNKAAWKTYRQALRDLPGNTTDPLNVTWPTPPS